MKIGIDLTPLYGRKVTGVEAYGLEFYKALMQSNHVIIPFFRKQNTIDDNPNSVIFDVENRFLVENILLPRSIRKSDLDIIFFPIFPPPVTLYIFYQGKIIPTIHDLAFHKYPEVLSFAGRYYLTPKYNVALRFAHEIITISNTIKTELADITRKEVFNLQENISKEYLYENSRVDESRLLKWNLLSHNYFIMVSSIEPRKNIKLTLEVFDRVLEKYPDYKIVLVGRKAWGNDGQLKLLIDKMGDKVIFTDFVPFEDLLSLYHYAKAFVLLSLDEGFGRTPLEAIAAGCKKIYVSDISIFHETLKDNAVYLPIDSKESCVKIILEDMPSSSSINNIELPFDVFEQKLLSYLMRFL